MIGICFPLSPRVHFPLVLGLCLVWLLNSKENLAHLTKGQTLRHVLLTASLYLLLVIAMTYTHNGKAGLRVLETMSSWVVLPIVILGSNLLVRHINLALRLFSLSIFLICLGCLVMMVRKALELGHGVHEFFTSHLYQTTYFSEPVGIHPTYLSMFIALAIAIIFFDRTTFRGSWLVKSTFFVILFCSNLFLLSRGGLLAMIAMLLIGFYILVTEKKYLGLAVATSCLFILGFFLFRSVPGYSKRIQEPLSRIAENWNNVEPDNSTAWHFKSWQCAIEKLATTTYVLQGYGTGDEVDVLVECYKEKDLAFMMEQKFNAHSEYLSILLKVGLLGLALLIMNIAVPFRIAIQKKDFLFLSFLVIFSVVSLFESTLNVYRGVVFFTFFNALFLKRCLSQSVKV